jgi:hypothetical protein
MFGNKTTETVYRSRSLLVNSFIAYSKFSDVDDL